MFPKIKRLLLVTDGSLYSEGAIREAISFAKRCQGRICAIIALEANPEYETIGSQCFEREEAEATEHLKRIKARAIDNGVPCETVLRYGGEPHHSIVEEAQERNSDMIVIGRRGHKGLARVLVGEVAAKVIGHSPCKVLVVPKAARIRCKNILVATNGSEQSLAAVTEAIEIAKCCGSNIIAASVMKSNDDMETVRSNVQRVVKLAQEEGLGVEAATPIGKSYREVLETAGGRGVDLIVMGTYGKRGLKKFLAGSTTEKVIGNAGCAVLVAAPTNTKEGESRK